MAHAQFAVDEAHRNTELFREMAERDALTGLWNRRALLRAVQDAVAEGSAVGLLLVDVTGVDQVNDALGHDAGDALLVQVAERLQAVAGTRLVARLAGD